MFFIALVAATSAIVLVGSTIGRPTPTNQAVYAYPSSNSTSTIFARVGETFNIQLSSNAGSTGYDWNVATSSGIHYLSYTTVSTATLPGGSNVRNYSFRADRTGTQTITLTDQRSWAPYQIAATIIVQVIVR